MNAKKTLRLTTYRPNFTDPRVIRQVRDVLEWSRPYLLSKLPTKVSSKTLTGVFGNQKNNLAAYLRANLLIQSGKYVVGFQSYRYSIKRAGFEKLSKAIGLAVKPDVEIARDVYGDIARGKVDIEYLEPSPGKRRYHAVQNLPRVLRASVFAGWYDYDIESAAPTLILQYARQGLRAIGSQQPSPYPALDLLVTDKARVRNHVGSLTGLPAQDVKRVINGIFFGAKLQPSPQTAVFQALGEDRKLLERLKSDRMVLGLVEQAKAMWKGLITFDAGKRSGNTNQLSKQRMSVYQSLEREVIEVMEAEMKAAGIRYVLMHDGFMANRPVNRKRLLAAVRSQTGFRVALSKERLGEHLDPGSKVDEDMDLMEDLDQ
jgi:hypothetical protein